MNRLAEDLRDALISNGVARKHYTLERLVCDPALASFSPSPAQMALVKAVDGSPIDHLSPERAAFHFGSVVPSAMPRRIVLRTGVRAGKSFLAAMGILVSILRSDFSTIREGELVRAVIVAPRLLTSGAPFQHLVGTMRASPRLSRMLVKVGAESCVIRRPDGHEVLVQIVAASSGGLNMRSTWLAAALFDEADFHEGEDGAVNLPDNISSAMPRLLPGAQCWVVSSPWADTGPFNELFTQSFGKPGTTIAFHSDTRSMNPTLSREDEEAERARDPDNAAREYDAIPLSAMSSLFFPRDAVDAAINNDRPMRLNVEHAHQHYAGADLGFRRNSSALAVARLRNGKVELAYHEELRPGPGASLKPSEVCSSFAQTCKGYGAKSVRGDLHYADTASEEMAKHNVAYDSWNPSGEEQAAAFTEFRRLMVERKLDLPNDPRLINSIRKTTTRVLPGGKTQVRIPTQGQAHSDVLMAIVLACAQVPTSVPGRPRTNPVQGYRFGNDRGFG